MGWNRNNKYFRWGLTALCVIMASAIFVVIFTNLQGFFQVIRDAIKILSPLIYGAVFAYLLNPLEKLVENSLRPRLTRKMKSPDKAQTVSRVLGVLTAILIGGFLVYGLFALVLPQLYETILSIVSNLQEYMGKAESWILNLLADHPDLQRAANSVLDKIYHFLQHDLPEQLLSNVQTYLTGVTNSVMAVVREIISILIGLVASIYILWSKDTFQSQAKKLIVAVFRPTAANRILYVGRETHRIFSGFIVGKIIDSLIVGVLYYIGMKIIGLPFPVLIATIVGVTNIIPFFGPFIGIIPSAVLILLVDPLQAFYFLIFAVILQQIDGNVIAPKILGDSIGISGFWVLISITLAGNLFGFAGMLLGVPVFAVLYTLLCEWTNRSLRSKHRPTVTEVYHDIQTTSDIPDPVDIDPGQIRFDEQTEDMTDELSDDDDGRL